MDFIDAYLIYRLHIIGQVAVALSVIGGVACFFILLHYLFVTKIQYGDLDVLEKSIVNIPATLEKSVKSCLDQGGVFERIDLEVTLKSIRENLEIYNEKAKQKQKNIKDISNLSKIIIIFTLICILISILTPNTEEIARLINLLNVRN